MITTFEQLWYLLAIGLFTALIGMIKYAITKYINYNDVVRKEQSEAMQDTRKALISLEITIKELQGVISLINNRCEYKHIPIDRQIKELFMTQKEHADRINKLEKL